eukprot:CAMPEP_0194137570 /NCGR_PEP_ID=MMETSP0152-20130528/7459_1 /TAXON_ID=1049557 /ORGANISM="Thalassiothrix antarctica, Strain L6-D1" /LENGTH=1691 /DNA_ID=CAMNT_0038834663 /DNA_START=284 /DNA_END=5359 /DNA_ORIENTATION=-
MAPAPHIQMQMPAQAPAPNGYQYQQPPQIQQPQQQPQYQQQPQQTAPPVAQPQQKQHFPHQGLNGGWQSDKDVNDRRKMIARIVQLLQQRKPNAPQEWLKKLPQMAKRLEESLYRSAKSFQEYNDTSTLKQRLQQLAVNIGMKTKMIQKQQQAQQQAQRQQAQRQQAQHQAQHQAQRQQQAAQQQQQQQVVQQQQQVVQQQQVAQQQQAQYQPAPQQQPQQQYRPPQQQYQQTAQPQQQYQHQHQHQQQQHQAQPMQPQPMQQPQQQLMHQQPAPAPAHIPQVQQAPQQRMVNMSDINPIMGQQQQQPQPQHIQAQAPQPAAQPQPVQMQYQPQQPAPTPAPQPAAPQPQQIAAPPGTNGARGRQVSDRQQVLRHQQQRLLLLRHAAKCQHEDGRCPVTPHCAGMKRLWKHIAECKDQKCLVPHCVSSRYVLSHYHRCKDVRCPVCGPVREAIHRSHEKQKQMQALKQRHQQAIQQNQVQPVPSAPQPQKAPPTHVAPPQPGVPPAVVTSAQDRPNKRPRTTPSVPVHVPVPAPVPVSVPVPVPAYPQQHPGQMPQTQRPIVQVKQVVQPVAVPSQHPGAKVKGYHPTNYQRGAARQPPGAPGVAYSNGQVIMPKHTGPKPQEDHTLINCFTIEQIETHIKSLNKGFQLPPQKLKVKCLDVLKALQSHQHGWVFNTPVDPVELGLPDYFEVIKRPMDLGTLKKRLENGCYHALEDFESHVNLTFENAMLYNPEGSVVFNMAKEMNVKFKVDYENLIRQLNLEEDAKRKNGEACSLCGCEKLLFEPPVFYCNGLNCPSKRIRRNSYYYVGSNNQYHWCHQCYQELKEGQQLDLGESTLKKEQLTKKKNDEVHEESWVQCDKCERWIHQICALFNTRQNKDQRSEYTCPRCTIEDRKTKGIADGTSTTPMAEDLQRTKLSERLERHVRKRVDNYFQNAAKDKAKSEGIPLEDAKEGMQMGGEITIRQVTSMDRKLEVRERMKRRYAFKNYPHEFTFRCKCIVVFQNLDGVDVILFGLYVYEHDEMNPAPNQRSVYVSYLDSVHYMRPRKMRTLIYHEILISYLDYVRRKGFASAHIWACPPLKGDDYILYAKPEDQKTPKDERLRQWYLDMLIECQRRGIVGKVTNTHDLYFTNEKNDASVVPYMDGDYFPAEVENIIKDIEEGKVGKIGGGGAKKKKNSQVKKNKKKSGRGGTRSTGLDEEALAASGIIPEGMEQKSLEEGGRDYVMVKLGETIQPMKESFIVAYLAWDGAKEEDMVVPNEIQEYRIKHGILPKISYKAASKNSEKEKAVIGTVVSNGDSGTVQATAISPASMPGDSQIGQVDVAAPASAPAPAQVPSLQTVTTTTAPTQAPVSNPIIAPNAGQTPALGAATSSPSSAASNTGGGNPGGANAKSTQDKPDSALSAAQTTQSIREGKFAAMAARKRNLEGQPKSSEKSVKGKDKEKGEEKNRETVKDSKGRTVTVLDDDIEDMDCEFLNNRQAFLNLCQGNHYQFDHLRRAKHSSMMVLWHLHNRDAPKFVQQCAVCSREILTGYRYHCPICADYDQCHECMSNPNTPRHPHQLKPIAIASGKQNELTAAQRKERQRSIQLHMTLLLHAATCNSPKCPSANCTKMKGLLKHGNQCQTKAAGGCHVCKRIWALLQLHARQCKATSCPVPNCMAIRERFRQLKKQQQAMDDRRRQEMNRAYRGAR